MPAPVDSNSPAFWRDGQFHIFNSTVKGPMLSSGASQFAIEDTASVQMTPVYNWPFWMEAVWQDPNGLIYGWYHQEFGPCPAGNYLAEPRIGAAVSYDGGKSFIDMGSIITTGEPVDCKAQNGYTAGGVGDFSVVLDQQQQYFYFFYSSYGGQLANEGICVARMAYADRLFPNGKVWKYGQGAWSQQGIGGEDAAIFPAKARWQVPQTNSFWGPSIHWNTYLNKYVMLLNHSCCSPRYPQDGIYIVYSGDLSNPSAWTAPVHLLNTASWYPQVIGNGQGASDSVAGRTAQLYVAGQSQWQIVFSQ